MGGKRIKILIIVALIAGGALWAWFRIFKVDANDFYCDTDYDCIPFVLNCGDCADYSIAINQQATDKYLKRYWRKCMGRYRGCEMMPEGESKCVNNKCEVVE